MLLLVIAVIFAVLAGFLLVSRHQGLSKKHIKIMVYYPHLDLYLKGITDMVLPEGKQAVLTVNPKNEVTNKPARVDGTPVWTNSDDSVASLTPANDGLSAVLAFKGEGATAVQVEIDADLGPGVRSLIGSLDVTAVGGEATVVEIGVGPLTDIPLVPAP